MGNLVKALVYCHSKIAEVVEKGDHVLDATCGNGKDTLFLANCVGNEGKVYAFDIQKEAISKASYIIEKQGVLGRVSFFNEGHENIRALVRGPLKAAMFNLGYLPGGNHEIITKPSTTIKALEGLFPLIQKGGLVSIMLYTGHAGGEEEKNTLFSFLISLNQKEFSVLHYNFINQTNSPPQLFLIDKK